MGCININNVFLIDIVAQNQNKPEEQAPETKPTETKTTADTEGQGEGKKKKKKKKEGEKKEDEKEAKEEETKQQEPAATQPVDVEKKIQEIMKKKAQTQGATKKTGTALEAAKQEILARQNAAKKSKKKVDYDL